VQFREGECKHSGCYFSGGWALIIALQENAVVEVNFIDLQAISAVDEMNGLAAGGVEGQVVGLQADGVSGKGNRRWIGYKSIGL
jgi:hypothetical protein